MLTVADYLISIKVDVDEVINFYDGSDFQMVKSGLSHIRDVADKAITLIPPEPCESDESSNGSYSS